ncbi:MAG: DUF6266 family protein [Balneolales bacterium]
MAKFKDGIFGPASGSVSNLILSHRRGKPYLKSKPDKVHNPQTQKQMASRKKLSMMARLLGTFKPFIRAGFTELPDGLSSRDVAYSANSKRIFTGEYPDIKIDYAKVLVSEGSLEPANGAGVELNGPVLTFTWDPDSHTDKPFSNHEIAMVLVYDAGADSIVYSLRASERRSVQFDFEIPTGMASSPDTLHAWISFASPDGKRVSDSVYLGLGDG